jgi:uncharacterized protein (DUF58 family)
MLTAELMKQVQRIELRTRKLVDDSFAGEYHSVFKGRGMAFEEVRPYQPGDEIRTIDWNVTARTGETYVKEFVEERELTAMFLVDASASGDFGSSGRFKREVAAELASVLSFAATTNNDRVGLMIFTDQVELIIPPRKGRKHVLRLVRELLAFQPQQSGTNIRLALDRANQLLKRRTIIFLVSDFIADPTQYQRALSITNRRHDLIAIDLHDPLETEIGNVGLLALEDPESGQIIWVDTANPDWHQAYQQQRRQHEGAKVQAMRQAQVDRIPIRTDLPYVPPLAAFFQDRAGRKRH